MEMGQEDGPFERAPIEQGRDPPEPGAGVQEEAGAGRVRRRRVVERQGDAGGVTAVVNELRPRGRGRSASTAKMDPHSISMAPDLRGDAPRRVLRGPSDPAGRPRRWRPGTG